MTLQLRVKKFRNCSFLLRNQSWSSRLTIEKILSEFTYVTYDAVVIRSRIHSIVLSTSNTVGTLDGHGHISMYIVYEESRVIRAESDDHTESEGDE